MRVGVYMTVHVCMCIHLPSQRDCELVVETMDKGGTFLGSITILPAAGSSAKPINLALSLMRAGLARLQPNVDPHRLPDGNALLDAQQQAKQAKLKVRDEGPFSP